MSKTGWIKIRVETGKTLLLASLAIAVTAAFTKEVTGFKTIPETIQSIAMLSTSVFGALYLCTLIRHYLLKKSD